MKPLRNILKRRLLLWMMLLPIAISAGDAARPVIHTMHVRRIPYLFLQDVAQLYGMRMAVRGKEVALTRPGISVRFNLNSRIMYLNGMQLYLSRPVAEAQGVRLLGMHDFQNILDPLLKQAPPSRKKVMTIVVDPGHGGKDSGAVAGKVAEKDINLAAALRTVQALQRAGFRVYMTRVGDSDVSLDERVGLASRVKADLFLSLHCNSAKSDVSGLETYIATRVGGCANDSAVAAVKPCPANRHDADNLYLAALIHRWILLQTKMPDRGLRHKRFYVVRNTVCPSLLVEMGFITNAAERKMMLSAVRQQQIADAIAAAVVRYRDVCGSFQ